MRTLSAPAIAALAARPFGLAQLVTMNLSSTVYLNTSSWNLVWAGNTYLGAAHVGSIGIVDDSPGEVKGLQFQLNGVPSDMLAIALAEPVQGKSVTIETEIFNANGAVVDAVVEWAGRLDVMTISEEGGGASISVSAEHIGIDLIRPTNLLFSNQDQQRLYAGDKFSEYVVDQSEQALIWPAASFWMR